MKWLIALTITLTVGMSPGLADTVEPAASDVDGMVEDAANGDAPSDSVCRELIAQGASETEIAQRGCCSWHRGVCGCSGSRIVCCDGSLSPSCGC
ncbi:MAG: hypothetical protein H6843_03225 [Rhodospirillaceae bacterium]|nr:hypothetical protein [Rhodospirillaceae bacterium]